MLFSGTLSGIGIPQSTLDTPVEMFTSGVSESKSSRNYVPSIVSVQRKQ